MRSIAERRLVGFSSSPSGVKALGPGCRLRAPVGRLGPLIDIRREGREPVDQFLDVARRDAVLHREREEVN
jgi:hypothetical protein